MGAELHLEFVEGDDGYVPRLLVSAPRMSGTLLSVPDPAVLEVWRGAAAPLDRMVVRGAYRLVTPSREGFLCRAELGTVDGRLVCQLEDAWRRVGPDAWRVDRTLTVIRATEVAGIRLRLDFVTAFPEGASFVDLRYFAPGILYDRNDLDEDGLEDYLQTQNLMFREDRITMLGVMAYDPRRGIAVDLARADVPEFDSFPYRPGGERVFVQKTDIGSLGFWQVPGSPPQMCLRACYPFYEGERSHALLLGERPGWEAFWPAECNEILAVSYQVRVAEAARFHEALWDAYRRRLEELRSEPVPLPAPPQELVDYRLRALNRYYLELSSEEDPNEPAGFVLNCHPQDGKQLSNIIQYGFTGQNILNAYNVMRYGYASGDAEYIRRARRVVDFFVEKAHIPSSGMFYNLYNADEKRFDFWWTGLLLPLAYARPGERLESLMGPIYARLKPVIDCLQRVRGSYLRCMSEDAYALLLAFDWERRHGTLHSRWLEAARRFGEFLVRTQERDGSWYRAYDLDGHPITDPPIWFGGTECERKSSSAVPIPFLVELYRLTGENRYLEAAKRAGRFVRDRLVEPVKFNGGVHDSMYSKGQLIDNEGILYPMLGLLALYRTLGEEEYRQSAIDAARLFATWIWLWDVPLPDGSTLARYGFRSTGVGACDTCGAGYVHPFQLMAVPELVEVAGMTQDPALFRIAELAFHGCNQTVAVPGRDWGYCCPGLQEEGYLISWCWLDDPIFRDTEFGRRWKGEGNKTCFPWIPAVAVWCAWKLLDRYGTLDFGAIRQKVLGPN